MIYRLKYPLVLALLLSAGLAGCIKERYDGREDGAKRPVVFSSSVGTRAAAGHPVENGATIPVGDYHFGVYAWAKPTAADPVEPFAELQNAKVQHAASEYTYSPVASWPRDADARLACMAYYPWSDQSGNIKVTTGTGANRTMTIDYTVPTDAGQHVDLMYAKTGMTAGYDPVNLDFRHALARLKFEGRIEGFPGGSDIKITGIKVTGAVLRGDLVVLDPTIQPGKPWWELSTAPGDKGTITMPVAHLKDLPLTSALQSVMTPGGDMLVLPQSITGLTVEVTASQGGTAFPEPFVFSLDATPEWTMNEIITYEITLMPDGMHLTARVAEWTTDPVNVVYDGQWWLSVTEDTFEFDPDGGTATLAATTNYNRSDLGYPAGLQVSMEYVTGGGSVWLTLTDQHGGSNGDLSRIIGITADQFTGFGVREAKIYVHAGNLIKIIKVIQTVPHLSIIPEDVLEFPSGLEVPVLTEILNISWAPFNRNVSWRIDFPSSPEIEFEQPSQLTGELTGGNATLALEPKPFVPGDIDPAQGGDLFLEKSARLTVTFTDDESVQRTKTVMLIQKYYAAKVQEDRLLPLNGSSQAIKIYANTPWEARLIDGGSAIASFPPASGGQGDPSNGENITFIMTTATAGMKIIETSDIEIYSPDNKFTAFTIQIRGGQVIKVGSIYYIPDFEDQGPVVYNDATPLCTARGGSYLLPTREISNAWFASSVPMPVNAGYWIASANGLRNDFTLNGNSSITLYRYNPVMRPNKTYDHYASYYGTLQAHTAVGLSVWGIGRDSDGYITVVNSAYIGSGGASFTFNGVGVGLQTVVDYAFGNWLPTATTAYVRCVKCIN